MGHNGGGFDVEEVPSSQKQKEKHQPFILGSIERKELMRNSDSRF